MRIPTARDLQIVPPTIQDKPSLYGTFIPRRGRVKVLKSSTALVVKRFYVLLFKNQNLVNKASLLLY